MQNDVCYMYGLYICPLNARAGTSFGYYAIEIPLPDLISKLRPFLGLLKMPLVGCQVQLVAGMAK